MFCSLYWVSNRCNSLKLFEFLWSSIFIKFSVVFLTSYFLVSFIRSAFLHPVAMKEIENNRNTECQWNKDIKENNKYRILVKYKYRRKKSEIQIRVKLESSPFILRSWTDQVVHYHMISYLPTPPLGQDMTQGQFFKWSLTGLNSDFSVS